jgi:hypothetical protein
VVTNKYGTLSNLRESTSRRAETAMEKVAGKPKINTNNINMKMRQCGSNSSLDKHNTKHHIPKATVTTYNGDGEESVNNQESESEPEHIPVIVNGCTASFKMRDRDLYKNSELTYTQNLVLELRVKLMNSKKSFTKSTKHKILLIGNSHLRGCAANLKILLNDQFEVSGTIKPRADSKILEQATSDIEKLTPKDAIILCCGTNYIGRMHLREVFNDVTSVVRKVSHTNLIILTIPYRNYLKSLRCKGK